ncbi:MAG: DUF5996 family protein [Gemmatimonadaceae bacterium]
MNQSRSTGDSRSADTWPHLPYGEWKESCATLHMWTQIIGKTRLALAPMENHWWNVPLYVTSRGLTTSPMPVDDRTFTVDFDFVDHNLLVRTSQGARRALPLIPRSVAEFHAEYMAVLHALNIDVEMLARPVEVERAIPFAADNEHSAYDSEYVNRFWRLLVQADRVLKEFRGRFVGKSSPVHFFWGSFDLALTRFSGRPAPEHPGGAPNVANWVMREAYSHEVISVGFWPGSAQMQEAAFYAYAYPEPAGLAKAGVRPSGAYYSRELSEFVIPYEEVRKANSPDQALLQFLESSYEAAAELAGWDRGALERRR